VCRVLQAACAPKCFFSSGCGMLPHTIRHINRSAKLPIQRLTLQEIFARSPAVSDAEHVAHAVWLQEQLPVRLASRLKDFIDLPFLVLSNSQVHQVFGTMLNAFVTLDDLPPLKTVEDLPHFAKTLKRLVRTNAEMIDLLQSGYAELRTISPDLDLNEFLDNTFSTRIGNRFLAEHFLAVHAARASGRVSERAGVVDIECCPADLVRALADSLCSLCYDVYGVESEIVLEGALDSTIAFIPDHLGFIIQEILKNALRSTIEYHISKPESIPPVTVEIMKGSFDVTVKVSDRGGGIRPDVLEKVWNYGYTTTREVSQDLMDVGSPLLDAMNQRHARSVAGYGFGLPLSRVYAKYFGGGIHLQSMHGYGTDVYLNINHLGDMRESHAVE